VLHQAQLSKELSNDWVRPASCCTAAPRAAHGQQFGLRPAMTLSSEIIGVQEPRGRRRRSATAAASRPNGRCAIGVVACGYADGYPRHAPHGTPVLVDGVKTTLVGGCRWTC
jgi:alanine racemase